MKIENAALVIGITILAVVAFNVLIYLAWRDQSFSEMVDMLRRSGQRANDPWKDEDAALTELSQLVKQLHQDDPQAEPGGKLQTQISEVPKIMEISARRTGDLPDVEPGDKGEKQ